MKSGRPRIVNKTRIIHPGKSQEHKICFVVDFFPRSHTSSMLPTGEKPSASHLQHSCDFIPNYPKRMNNSGKNMECGDPAPPLLPVHAFNRRMKATRRRFVHPFICRRRVAGGQGGAGSPHSIFFHAINFYRDIHGDACFPGCFAFSLNSEMLQDVVQRRIISTKGLSK